MYTTKKKPHIPLIILGAVLAVCLGYLVNGAWKEGMEFVDFLNSLNDVLSNPLRDYFNEYTPKAIVSAVVIYLIIVVMYYTSQKNYMPGREYGTAMFVPPYVINRVIAENGEFENRILSQGVRMSLNTELTGFNNNIIIIGGSGAGKSFRIVMPNLMQLNSSFIITDPKGELLRNQGEMLRRNGYQVKVINLIDMEQSDCYNPFDYIREEKDIVALVTNIISTTTPKDSAPTDPFWNNAEGMILQALFFFVWMEYPPAKRNIGSVMELLSMAKAPTKDEPSELDIRMEVLATKSPLKDNHPAVRQYRKVMRGAGDTIRSIIISANARLAKLENQKVLHLLSKDELHFEELGIGKNGDGHTKTALFCVIPDSDKSYNFIIGMLYTQVFQELYHQADRVYGGKLPVHVTFMLDEFANVALPDDFCSLISTMRSREISSVVIVQNLAQLKVLFKDSWESITGNCDTTIYLGGNEQSTHEYISKLLGKTTIDKKSYGLTRGRQGSSSQNMDVLGRDLMTPDEVRMLPKDKCLVIIRGLNPVMDDKYRTQNHVRFSQCGNGGGDKFQYVRNLPDNILEEEYTIITPESLKYYTKLADSGSPVYIDDIKYEEFMVLKDFEMKERFQSIDEEESRRRAFEEADVNNEIKYVPDEETEKSIMAEQIEIRKKALAKEAERAKRKLKEKPDSDGNSGNDGTDNTNSISNTGDGNRMSTSVGRKDNNNADGSGSVFRKDSITERLKREKFTKAQRNELDRAIEDGLDEDYILSYAYPENTIVKMMAMRKNYMKDNQVEKGDGTL